MRPIRTANCARLGLIALALAALTATAGCANRLALHGVGAPRPAGQTAVASNEAAQMLAEEAALTPPDAADLATANLQAEEDFRISGQVPPMPEMGANRDAAVAEIRRKAEGTGHARPDVFRQPVASAKQLTAADLKKLEEELAAKEKEVDGKVSPEEIAALRAELERLRRRAAAHYQESLNRIEK